MIDLNLSLFSDSDLIGVYSHLLQELKSRGIIRTNNVVAELGEYIAIEHYKKPLDLPTLSLSPTCTEAFDATSSDGRRYSIKTTTRSTTGSFFGLPAPETNQAMNPPFDFLVVVKLDETYSPEYIIELTWEQFLKYRRWIPRQKAYRMPLNRNVQREARTIYTRA